MQLLNVERPHYMSEPDVHETPLKNQTLKAADSSCELCQSQLSVHLYKVTLSRKKNNPKRKSEQLNITDETGLIECVCFHAKYIFRQILHVYVCVLIPSCLFGGDENHSSYFFNE